MGMFEEDETRHEEGEEKEELSILHETLYEDEDEDEAPEAAPEVPGEETGAPVHPSKQLINSRINELYLRCPLCAKARTSSSLLKRHLVRKHPQVDSLAVQRILNK